MDGKSRGRSEEPCEGYRAFISPRDGIPASPLSGSQTTAWPAGNGRAAIYNTTIDAVRTTEPGPRCMSLLSVLSDVEIRS